MTILREFRDFINRGNVIDLAVGIVIGAAFTAIVNSLVDDLLMPVIGVLSGGIDFTGLAVTVGEATIAYGNFIQAVINFLIIAAAVFFMVRVINRLYQQKEEPPAPPSDEAVLLAEIRDLLKQQPPRTVT